MQQKMMVLQYYNSPKGGKAAKIMLSNKDYRFKTGYKHYFIQPTEARFIWADIDFDRMPWQNINSYCMFRRTFDLESICINGKIKTMVDSKLCLYVNGSFVKRTLFSGVNSARIYDETDITKYLVKGKNVIAIMALHYGYDTIYSQSDAPGVFFSLNMVLNNDKTVTVNSDRMTRSKICESFDKFAPKINLNGGCVEIFDNRKTDENWKEIEYDDSLWGNSRERVFEFPSSITKKRITDKKTEKKHLGKVILSASTLKESDKTDLYEKITEELELLHFNNMYMPGTKCEIKPTEIGTSSYIVVRFGKERRGRISLDIDGIGGEKIDVIYGNNFEDGEFEICGISEFVLKNGNNKLESFFDDYVFRYVMLIVRNHIKTVNINSVDMIADKYEFDSFMEFETDMPELSDMFNNITTSIKNLYMTETMYYKGLEPVWHLSSARWQNLAFSIIAGDDSHFKRNIIKFSELIYEKGYRKKIFSHYETRLMVEDSLTWISSFGDLYDLTEDSYLFEQNINKITSLMKWISGFENEDGLLCDIGKDGLCSTTLNCTYVMSIKNLVKLTKISGAIYEYTYYRNKLKDIVKTMKLKMFCEEKGVYSDGLINGIQMESYSNDANALAILSLHEKGERRIKTIVKNAFRELDDSFCFPASVVKALLKAGDIDTAYKVARKKIGAGAEGVFLIEGVLGLDTENLKDSEINVYIPENVSIKAKLKTNYRTYEIETKNTKIRVK